MWYGCPLGETDLTCDNDSMSSPRERVLGTCVSGSGGAGLGEQAEFPRFGGLPIGVYDPRSVDWHRASRCIISLLQRITDGNQVAPLTREHPRRRYTPVHTPWQGRSPRDLGNHPPSPGEVSSNWFQAGPNTRVQVNPEWTNWSGPEALQSPPP